MLCGSLSFALMTCCASVLSASCDWRVVALARGGLAFLFAVFLCRSAGARLIVWRPRVLWLRSIAGSLSLLCTFFALSRLEVEEVLTLTNTFPLWVAFLSWAALNERLSASVWLSLVSGVVGVALIQQPRFAEGNFATLLALGAAFTSAVAMLGLNRLADLDPRAIVAHFSGVATATVLVSFLFLHGRAPAEPRHSGAALVLLLLGVGLTATVGQLFLTKAFTVGKPSKVSVVGLSQVVFAMALENLYRPRSYNALTLLGMALTLAPTAWVLTRGRRRRPTAAPERPRVAAPRPVLAERR
jgi:drug/metabolite transporter (DMT)-like permease